MAQRRVCCICRFEQISKKSAKKRSTEVWRNSTSYEKDFENCFGARAEGRTGNICNSCRCYVAKYKRNNDLSFPEVLDSRSSNKQSESTRAGTSAHVEHSFNSPVLGDITNGHISSPTKNKSTPPRSNSSPPRSNSSSKKPAVQRISFKSPSTTTRDESLSLSPSKRTLDESPPPTPNVSLPPTNANNHAIQADDKSPTTQNLNTAITSPSKRSRDESPPRPPPHDAGIKSPGKRTRDVSPPPTNKRSMPSRLDFGMEQNAALCISEGPPISFMGKVWPRKLVAKILSLLSTQDCVNVIFNFLLPELEQNYQKEKEALTEQLEKEREDTETKLTKFVDVQEDGPLTQPQKVMLQKLIVNRENNTDDYDCIVIPQVGSGGKPKHYLKVPKIEVNSGEAAKRTKNKRSQFIEKVEKLISTPITSKPTDTDKAVHSQRVNNIARDKEGYSAAAEEAGLKIVTKFSRETILSLRSIMTLRMWRVLKSVFKCEIGWDVFGSVQELQKELQNIEFEYECGTYSAATGVPVHFVRVTDVKQVVKQMIVELNKAGQLVYLDNLPKQRLWLYVALDKGGKTTKLILQVMNQKYRHSIDNAKLIGYFEGKDNRLNIEFIFGPILSQLQDCLNTISELKLPKPPVPDQESTPCTDHSKCDESIRWKPLMPFDLTNTTSSPTCQYCKHCVGKKRTCSIQPLCFDQVDESIFQSDVSDKDLSGCTEVQVQNQSQPISMPRQLSSTPDEIDQPSLTDASQTSNDESSKSTTNSRSTQLPAPDKSQSTPDQPVTPLPSSSDIPSCSTAGEQLDLSNSEFPPRVPSDSGHDSSPSASCHATPGPSVRAPVPATSMETPQRSTSTRSQPRNLMDSDLFRMLNPIDESVYLDECLSCGGDWEGTAKVCGLSGPNGKFFCNHCLVQLKDTEKGIPHALHILPKYDRFKKNVNDSHDYPLRTFDRCREQYQAKVRAEGKAMNYESCENEPLLRGDLIIDCLSTTPLHISLGLGLQILNIIEAEAVQLDKEIKTKEGLYDAFNTVYDHKREVLEKCQSIKEEISEVDDKIEHVKEKKIKIIKERAEFFKKDKRGRYEYRSDMAEGVRSRYAQLDEEKGDLLKNKETLEKRLKGEEKKLDKVLEELVKIKGPFKTMLDNVLDDLKLQRAAYHSGALVGPDVKKLVTKKNIVKIGKVFRPIQLQLETDEETRVFGVFGSNALRVKLITLLTKFSQCYELYTANRPLCRHEVELLVLRCSSFGSWFPPNFPDASLKRKFHLLTVCVPRQVRRLRSVGILTEQTIESIHPYINELDRRFAKVADKARKGLIICKQQNMYSQPRWNAVKRLGRKKKKKVGRKK